MDCRIKFGKDDKFGKDAMNRKAERRQTHFV